MRNTPNVVSLIGFRTPSAMMKARKKMTYEQKIWIVKMRLEGTAIEAIAKKIGCTRQNVYFFLKSLSTDCVYRRGPKPNPENWDRPALGKWIRDNSRSVGWIAGKVGVSSQSISRWFRYGQNIPYWHAGTVMKIAEVTGISEEELIRSVRPNRRKEA